MTGFRTFHVGAMNSDYFNVSGDDYKQTDNYTLTGASKSMLASRVAYVYDLRGPATAVDSACSSALMAIHVACQALRSGLLSIRDTSEMCDTTLKVYIMLHSGITLLLVTKQSPIFACQR